MTLTHGSSTEGPHLKQIEKETRRRKAGLELTGGLQAWCVQGPVLDPQQMGWGGVPVVWEEG